MEKCILTNRDIKIEQSIHSIYYRLKIADNEVEIVFCDNCKDKIKLNVPFSVVSGLIANNKWPKRSYIKTKECINKESHTDFESIILPDFLETTSYPKSPSEKMDHFFLNLFKMQNVDGELVEINLKEEIFWTRNYFQNHNECFFYIEGLKEKGFIQYHNNGMDVYIGSFKITHLGLNKAVELLKEGNNSKNCFIAMAFNEQTKPYRDAIKRALNTTGFKPIIIDEEHLASDKTIPDSILSGIKKSKFCVADFTCHRNGVYFESGYAVGLGKPVIYLCEEKEFKKAHFDIKQLQHIIYTTSDDLEKRLTEKIEAWILE